MGNSEWSYCRRRNAFQVDKREIYEESGVTEAELLYPCDYLVHTSEGHANGAVFLAIVNELGELPESEMAEVGLFDLLPDNLTYPFFTFLLINLIHGGIFTAFFIFKILFLQFFQNLPSKAKNIHNRDRGIIYLL